MGPWKGPFIIGIITNDTKPNVGNLIIFAIILGLTIAIKWMFSKILAQANRSYKICKPYDRKHM